MDPCRLVDLTMLTTLVWMVAVVPVVAQTWRCCVGDVPAAWQDGGGEEKGVVRNGALEGSVAAHCVRGQLPQGAGVQQYATVMTQPVAICVDFRGGALTLVAPEIRCC